MTTPIEVRGCFNKLSTPLDLYRCVPLGTQSKLSIWFNKLIRKGRDLNPRVQWTVDFESTAIPGYATSAQLVEKSNEDKRNGRG